MSNVRISRIGILCLAAASLCRAQATADTRSVAAFGAFPDDGATDATPGIQAAINRAKGGRVYLPGDLAGTGVLANATLSGGSLTAIKITSPGSHYCKAPRIVFTGGGGHDAAATARIDKDCRVAGISLTNPGAGYTQPPDVHIVPALRCYKVSQVTLSTGTMLEGDGEASCLIPDGSNKPLLYSDGAYKFRIRNIAVYGDGVTDVGLQFNGEESAVQQDGSPASDALLCTLDAVTVTGFRSKNIELNRTYGFLFLNVHSSGSGGWGLYLRDGFNNATQIVGGEYSQNAVGGLYIGTDSIQLYFSSISEGNKKYAIYYRGHLTGLHINDAYFEGNGYNHTGYDVYGDFLDYDHPAIGVSIRNTLFNSLDAAQAVHIENTVDLEISHNIGMPPLLGDAFLENAVILGKGVVNPVFEGNTRLDVRGDAGAPVHTGPARYTENLLLQANALNGRAWTWNNAGRGCPPPQHACQDGTRFRDEGPAWKIPLPPGSNAANMTMLTQTPRPATAGHLIGAGAWMRTAAGSATAWVEVFDAAEVYTGSALNQPLRQSIDTNWRWIAANVTTAARNGPASIRFRLYGNDGEDAKAVYIFAPQGWLDSTGIPLNKTPAALRALTGPPDCKGQVNGIVGYEAGQDKIWACNNGVAKAH